jgi:hypothetical protein
MPNFPRCAICRASIEAGDHVVFRPDGRVNHVQCDPVICAVCARPILPAHPIRRDGDALLHATCWLRRYRAQARAARLATEVDPLVVASIRGKIAAGVLPPPPAPAPRIWAGHGRQGPCEGCEQTIDAASVEYEVDVGERTLHFHRVCLLVWQQQTPKIRGGN